MVFKVHGQRKYSFGTYLAITSFPTLSQYSYLLIFVFEALMEIPHNDPPVLEGDYMPQLKDLVSCCLRKKPNKRLTAAQCLEHPFIANSDSSANPLENLISERLQVILDLLIIYILLP